MPAFPCSRKNDLPAAGEVNLQNTDGTTSPTPPGGVCFSAFSTNRRNRFVERKYNWGKLLFDGPA
jgi:hypothetical protein